MLACDSKLSMLTTHDRLMQISSHNGHNTLEARYVRDKCLLIPVSNMKRSGNDNRLAG